MVWQVIVIVIGGLAMLIGMTALADQMLPPGGTLPTFGKYGETFDRPRREVLWTYLLFCYPASWLMAALGHFMDGLGAITTTGFGAALAIFLQGYSLLGTWLRVRKRLSGRAM